MVLVGKASDNPSIIVMYLSTTKRYKAEFRWNNSFKLDVKTPLHMHNNVLTRIELCLVYNFKMMVSVNANTKNTT